MRHDKDDKDDKDDEDDLIAAPMLLDYWLKTGFTTRICRKCEMLRPVSMFRKGRAVCKRCQRTYHAQWHARRMKQKGECREGTWGMGRPDWDPPFRGNWEE